MDGAHTAIDRQEQMNMTESLGYKQKPQKSKGRRIGLLLAKLIGGFIVVLALFFLTVYLVNVFGNKSDLKKIEAYGQQIEIDGKKMNVLIQGSGEETIVLLPGYGTAAPALDFEMLIKELSPNYTVVVVEPFGYGLSDKTDKERTSKNITNEIHEALSQLNIDRYILMGHSISGIYGLQYINDYPDEVTAFVGIDTSVPTQPGSEDIMPFETLELLAKSGFSRFFRSIGPDPYAGLNFDEHTVEQMKLLTNVNENNATMLNELEHSASNFRDARQLSFPAELPLLLFVVAHDQEVEGWIELHEEQIAGSSHGEMVALDGTHYLHHTKSKEIAQKLKDFMDQVQK
jgi:pimeloyl-ACP methyl ester carboxylesterase